MRYFLFAFLFVVFSANASIGTKLNDFYHSAGATFNSTAADSVKTQSAGGWTGGGLSARTPVAETQLISAVGPGMRGGCAGIDAHFGAISLIRSQELKSAMKQMMNNVASYSMMIALESLCPMCKKQMDQLNKLLQDLNQMSISHCEAAAALAGTIMPKTQANQHYTCSTLGSSTGIFKDYGEAALKCGQGKSNEVFGEVRRVSEKPEAQLSERERKLKSLSNSLSDKGNLAWMILLEAPFIKSQGELGKDFAELIMSLSGSLIVNSDGGDSIVWTVLPSFSNNEILLRELLGDSSFNGSAGDNRQAQIWHCDHKDKYGCLNPYKATLHQSAESKFIKKVRVNLSNIQKKIQEDEALTKEEKELINIERWPLLSILNAQTIGRGDVKNLLRIEDFAEVVAGSVLKDYLSQLLDVVSMESNRIQVDRDTMDRFLEGVTQAKHNINRYIDGNLDAFQKRLDMVQKWQVLEKQLSAEQSSDWKHMLGLGS